MLDIFLTQTEMTLSFNRDGAACDLRCLLIQNTDPKMMFCAVAQDTKQRQNKKERISDIFWLIRPKR